MEAVDRVPPVHDARAHEQHVARIGFRGERTQRAGNQRRSVTAQHLVRRHVARVTRVTSDGVGGVAERVVVVVHGDDARAAMDTPATAPARGRARRRCRRRCAACHAHLRWDRSDRACATRARLLRERAVAMTRELLDVEPVRVRCPRAGDASGATTSARVPLGAHAGPGGREIAAPRSRSRPPIVLDGRPGANVHRCSGHRCALDDAEHRALRIAQHREAPGWMSIGSASTVAPRSFAWATVASVSATSK